LDYKPVDDLREGPHYVDPNGIYNRTGRNGETIFEGTSILVPVIVAMFITGELYEGIRLKTPEQLRYSANIEIRKSGPMWATIMKKGDHRSYRIVNNLKDYYVATPLFRLIVPENSLLMDKTDVPYLPGIYDMVAAGIFLLITSLPPSTYRINFGGKSGAYHTNSVYDISIQGKRKETMRDLSNRNRILKQAWK
jgi:hypothetical protein